MARLPVVSARHSLAAESPKRLAFPLGMMVGAVLIATCVGAAATKPEGPEEFELRITNELQALDSGAADLFRQANAARERQEWAEAERLYREVLERRPEFFHATRRLADVVLMLGRRQEAIELCRQAFAASESPENRSALVRVLATGSESSKPTQDELREALGHSRALLRGNLDGSLVAPACIAAVAADDLPTLGSCVERLRVVAPDEMYTHYFAWIEAMSRHRHGAAVAELERAHELGLPDEQYGQMRDLTREAAPVAPRILRAGLWVLGVWAVLFVVLLLAGNTLSRLTLRAAREPAAARSGASTGLSARLRAIYRAVLWATCVFYYLSVPLMLVLVVGLGGGILYALLSAGRIPLKLVAIVVVVVCVTVWATVKSFFVRGRDADPGERLDLEQHPRLRQILLEVARQIGTRPVDNVYMTPGTDLAVMERGGILRQLRGQTERCLILGVAVLEGMKLGPFKAILAHEYGHFSNRDTAGGGFALAVRRSMIVMARQLAAGGAATWYNPAWLFLNGFNRVFLRISQGASRLQEVLADRWAAFAYGARSFERGLRHVIERSIRFDAHANAAVQEVVDGQKPLANLYSYRPGQAPDEAALAQAVEATLTARPSPYDSHPAPAHRFELVNALEARPEGDLHDENKDAWTLFGDRDAIERWMTANVRANLQARYGVTIAQA